MDLRDRVTTGRDCDRYGRCPRRHVGAGWERDMAINARCQVNPEVTVGVNGAKGVALSNVVVATFVRS